MRKRYVKKQKNKENLQKSEAGFATEEKVENKEENKTHFVLQVQDGNLGVNSEIGGK